MSVRKLQLQELGRVTTEEFKKLPKVPITIILDNIRSGINIGSVFRTMDAFRLEQLMLCGICAKPPHKEIAKSAIGADQSVSWTYHEHILDAIDQISSSHKIVGVEQTTTSVPLDQMVPSKKPMALIFGNEVRGISEDVLEHVDEFIEVPQFGSKHSLNVSVCAGIVIWHYMKPFIQNMR